MYIAIRTEKPEAEILIFDESKVIETHNWHAHKQLSSTILFKITDLLAGHSLTLGDIQGLACFTDGGSFTGLRIGASVANALAASLQVPVVSVLHSEWLVPRTLCVKFAHAEQGQFIAPHYDRPATTTQPKK